MPPAEPVYVVINHARSFDVPSTRLQGIYPKFSDIGHVEDNITLLPVLIQCLAEDVAELRYIQDIIEDAHCGDIPENDEDAKSFVEDVIVDMASKLSPIFSHCDKFYGVLGTATTTKMVAMSWTPTPGTTYHIFSDFARAFIYVLAGGNPNLIKWGLKAWIAYEGETRRRDEMGFPLARFGAGLFSSSFGSGFFSRGAGSGAVENADAKGAKGKGKSKGLVEDGLDEISDQIPGALAFGTIHSDVPLPDPTGRLANAIAKLRSEKVKEEELAASVPEFVQGRAPTSTHETPSPPLTPNQKTLPDYIISPDSLAQLQDAQDDAPFMALRDPHSYGYTRTSDEEALVLNGPLPLNHRELPPLITFYLRTHGWSERVVDVVSIAHECEATLKGFLKTLGREGMALAEASFVWHALRFL